MTTLEIILCLAFILAGGMVVRLLLSAAKTKTQLARFQQLIDLEAEQEKVKAITAELRRKNERMRNITDLQGAEAALNATLTALQQRHDVLTREKSRLEGTLANLKEQLSPLEDDLMLQNYGLYAPKYDFESAARYKTEIASIRDRQKQMIRAKTAILCDANWTVDGSQAKGQRMIHKQIRLMARAFNGECDSIIPKVKYNNFFSIEKRILSAYQAINKLGESQRCEINPAYLTLKCDELHLVHEYQEQLQAEKEEARRIREQIREEERAQRELEKARSDAEKETARYERALAKARREVEQATGEKQATLQGEVQRLNELLLEAQATKERAISRAQQTRAGHVYVISNIGAFGEDVYKIGMTRRLEPQDRVRELSGASVPFQFDVHAMIYSEDAPALENLLHSKLEHRSVNRVNARKEFFNVTLEEIEAIILHFDANAAFIRIPPAEEFRKTQAILAEEHQARRDI